jgi:cysteine-rich repeat protein
MKKHRVDVVVLALGFVLSAAPYAAAGVVEVAVGFNSAISADGQRLYFNTDVFDRVGASRVEHDLALGTEVPAPLPALPTGAISGTIVESPSGRYLAFVSIVDLVPADFNGQYDVYVLDTVTSTVTLESVGDVGQLGFGGLLGAEDPSMSVDGRYLVFSSSASNLVPVDVNGGQPDVFVRDRCVSEGVPVPVCTPSTALVSFGPAGVQSDGGCELRNKYAGGSSISADGRWVTFSCWSMFIATAGTFAPGHACGDPYGIGCTGAYVRDLCESNGAPVPACVPATELVSLTPGGDFPNAGAYYPVISGDGMRILYSSTASDIVPEDPGPTSYDVFFFDRGTSTTTRLTTPPPYSQLFGNEISMSQDGLHAAWAQGQSISYWADCAGIAPTCGDSAVELACEECDDGNLVDGDGCDSNCTFTACNNGITTAGEGCDDGNVVNGDGCDSNCTPTSCGNNIRTAAEPCDDGDLTSGDGCSDTCAIEPGELTPGGTGKTDCQHEFMPYFQPPKVKGIPRSSIVCQDDDPSCDLGGTPGDKRCYFRLALCANVTDPRLSCTPVDLARVAITKPKFESTDIYDVFNWDWLAYDLGQLGGVYTGRCTAPPVSVGKPCMNYYDCNDGAVGKCSKPLFEFDPPLAATNQCSDFGRVAVPVKEPVPGLLKNGSLTLKLKASASNDPVTGKPRNVDNDGIKLICLPATP